MAGKYGSASVFFLVDGYNLIANKLRGLRYKSEALAEETTGLGDTWAEHTPTGVQKVELVQDGGFFDTTLNRIHTAMSGSVPGTPQDTVRVGTLGFAASVGEPCVGFEGVFSTAYEVMGTLNELTKANAEYMVTGQLDKGVVLLPLTAYTDDWTGTAVDSGASSASGGVGYLQVSASFDTFIGKIKHSDDGVSYTDLITFSTVTSSPTAERVTVAGTIKRYLRFDGEFTAETSSSISPSASVSLSASASISPSTSLSPSASASYTPSASISASISASASVSPSASISPSASSSASVSPSAGGAASATVLCAFARS